MKRFLILFMVIGLMSGLVATAEAKNRRAMRDERIVPVHSATTEKAPARSGTIVTGASGLHSDLLLGCEMAPDCRAWLASRCNPALTGHDPALAASIEDVADLANRAAVWIFEHAPGAAALAKVQLWRQNCTEIASFRSGSAECNECSFLDIPRSAKWMTVTGYTYNPWAVWPPVPNILRPLTLEWTLTRYSQRGRA